MKDGGVWVGLELWVVASQHLSRYLLDRVVYPRRYVPWPNPCSLIPSQCHEIHCVRLSEGGGREDERRW